LGCALYIRCALSIEKYGTITGCFNYCVAYTGILKRHKLMTVEFKVLY